MPDNDPDSPTLSPGSIPPSPLPRHHPTYYPPDAWATHPFPAWPHPGDHPPWTYFPPPPPPPAWPYFRDAAPLLDHDVGNYRGPWLIDEWGRPVWPPNAVPGAGAGAGAGWQWGWPAVPVGAPRWGGVPGNGPRWGGAPVNGQQWGAPVGGGGHGGGGHGDRGGGAGGGEDNRPVLPDREGRFPTAAYGGGREQARDQ
ncbi:uncharacterized protein BKCO1_6100064 [Diplodia corticola]|uniref:Uncharacterized protein n=1 Tax=Diplodia corticola TaxID=236234 RepID=A0A1J9RR40_9PEZI|nr:uncharacterized protein BKCO1_6100064 [Diplodia corticola]OJD30364.1 hypothetical protein BKCO1_6100064 [Diplodia corticola]